MISKKTRHVKLWLLMVIAVVFWTVGTGFYRDLSAKSEEAYEELKVFSDVIEMIEREYVDEVDTKELIQKAIQGMVHSLDPHSSLLPLDAFQDLQIDTKGKFTGIGIHITMQDGFVTVISPIEDTPAHKAGIIARDRIIKVDGKPTKDLRQAVNMMRGPKGTKVVVTIFREGVKKPLDFELIRDVIPILSVKSFNLKPGFGYIRLSNFTGTTTTEMQKALKKMENAEVPLKGLVLDLRNNGGGLLNQSIKVADLFLDEGIILSIKGRNKKNTKVFNATPSSVKRNYPLVVLINGGSASASEIVAGALQDHRRALILGTTSFGKGSVQTVETLRDGSGLKLTIARYYTPNDRSIQAKGIKPDIYLKHRRLDPKEISQREEGLLKEKDLENHLEAEPSLEQDKDSESEDEKDKNEKKQRIHEMEQRVGPLTLEALQIDNQVRRALQMLEGYDIFKNLKG
ncbi:MAG: S41 family peptidase [Deltaproteobacteria bacterium]|jgi:carboxyl-terminal processing protease|nr:S41 family peptidase [Deltaproteobacteria bacterium]MBW2582250.1 S41 family peptidase [Deltaproteobacteria bacterium]